MSTQIMWKLGTHESVKIQSNLYGNIRLQMFDIDKLYLTRLSYRIQKEEKDGKVIQHLTSNFTQEDGATYHQNELINSYLTLLKRHGEEQEDGSISISDSMTTNLGSVDGDTKLITDVLDDIESDKPATRNYSYRFGNLTVQALIHQDLLGGKFGIGPFALNNNNQVLTQLYKVEFNVRNTHILTNLGITKLYEPKDKDNNSKLSWLSGFINANVDVAKDPYITRLNVNKFTYNLVNLLIRGGMGKRTLYFTTQPIMVEMAKAFNDAEDAFMGEFNKTASQRQRQAVQKVIYDTAKRSSFSNKFVTTLMDNSIISELFLSQIAQQLFGTSNEHHDNIEHSLLYRIMKSKDVRKNTNNAVSLDNLDGGIQNIEITINNDLLASQLASAAGNALPNVEKTLEAVSSFYNKLGIKTAPYGTHTINISALDTQVLVALVNNQFTKYGNTLADLVAACKIDTKKYGKSYVEQRAFLDKYGEVFDNKLDYFNGSGLFALKENSYIQTKVDNATNLYRDIIANISIQADDTFNIIVNNILDIIEGDSKNTQLVRKINKTIMTFLKQKYFDNYMSEKERDDLLFGDNTVQDNLIRIINKLKSSTSPELKQYVSGGVIINKLLGQLTADHYNVDENFDHAKFVILENTMSDESTDINEITRAWDDLFQDDVNYITLSDGSKKTFRQFAIDLAIYAFITSGDTNGQTKFFKYVPNTIKQHIGYADYMRNINTEIANYDQSDIIDYVVKANWNDERFVKTVSPVKYIKNTPVSMLKQGITISRPVTKKIADSNGVIQEIQQSVKIPLKFAAVDSNGNPTIKRRADGSFPQYVRMKRAAATRFESDYMLLYKLDNEIDGNIAIYKLAEPNVSTVRAGSYSYDVYGMNNHDLSYPSYVREALRNIGFRFAEGENPQQVLVNFVDEIKRLDITFETNKQLELQLESELKDYGYNAADERWQSYLQQALDWVKQQLDNTNKQQTKQYVQQKESEIQKYRRPHSITETGISIYNLVLANNNKHVKIRQWSSLEDTPYPIVRREGTITGVVSTIIKQNPQQSFGNTYSSQDNAVLNAKYPMNQTITTQQSVIKYIQSVINPESSNWPEHYRWIQEQIKSGNLKNLPIFHYADLGEPSHADALDYLINHYNFDNNGTENNTSETYINHSGGAIGADNSTTNKKRENWVQGELFDDSEFEEDNMNHCKGRKPKKNK